MLAEVKLTHKLETLIAVTFVIGQRHKRPIWVGMEHQGEGRTMYHLVEDGEIQSSSPNKTLIAAVFRQKVAEQLEEVA